MASAVRAAAREDAWPHTTRLMPWALAGFLVVVILTPFDTTTVRGLSLPFDSKLDRVVIAGCVGLWVVIWSVGRRPVGEGQRGHRFGAVDVAMVVLFLAVAGSLALNAAVLGELDELSGGVRKVVVLASYFAFFYLFACCVRPVEIPAYVALVVGLVVIAALGTLIEYRLRINVFTRVLDVIPGLDVQPDRTGVSDTGRSNVTGPARHGLAASTMLAMALPFALVQIGRAREARRKILYGVAALIILAGCLATVRRSAVVVPVASVAFLLLVGRRAVLPVLPVVAALLLLVPVAAPGLLEELRDQFSPENLGAQQSTAGRTQDFAAAAPDVAARPFSGRGFGTYDPNRYRILDNQYLMFLIETGVAGVLAFLALLATAVRLGLRVARSPNPLASQIGLAAAGSAAAFAVASLLFDSLSFGHAPYFFFWALAAAVLSRRLDEAPPALPADIEPSLRTR